MASFNTIEKLPEPRRTSSRDTIYSSNSSSLLQKRKPVHPLAASVRINTRNNVQQRVLSAKLLKLKQLQNQLNTANYQLAELQQENRALKTLQQRQDKALAKYEGANAELPRLLQSYEEEIRVLQSKNKTLRKAIRDAAEQMKIKDEELGNLREQIKHLTSLTKDRHLEERQKLGEQVEDLKHKLEKKEEEISLLNRKHMVEIKNNKYKINTEVSKNKQCLKQLQDALNEVDRLNLLLEDKKTLLPGTSSINKKRFGNVEQRQAISLVNLDSTASNTDIQHFEEEHFPESNDSALNENNTEDVKLEPIPNEANKLLSSKSDCNILESPSERIKARLSGKKPKESKSSSSNFGKLEMSESDLQEINNNKINIKDDFDSVTVESLQQDRSRLNILEDNLKSCLKKATKHKDKYALNEGFEHFCSTVINSVRTCNDNIERQRNIYEQSKAEMDNILDDLEKTDQISQKLKLMNLQIDEKLEVPAKDADLVNEILKEEYAFQKSLKKSKESGRKFDLINTSNNKRNGYLDRETDVAQEDKRKLLETLKAIDDGEDIGFDNNFSSDSIKKTNLMKDLFEKSNK